jgi:hypothetical protein
MNKLLICPECSNRGIRQVLGSIDHKGHLAVMRYRTGLTYVEAEQYKVVCTCGFGTTITSNAGKPQLSA